MRRVPNKLLLCFIVAFQGVAWCEAAQKSFLDKYVKTNNMVSSVEIVKGEAVEFFYEGEIHRCGFNYVARPVDVVKGRIGDNFRFMSSFSLSLGSKYLIVSESNVEKNESNLISWYGDYSRAYEKCTESLEGDNLGEEDFFMIKNFPSGHHGEWLVIYDEDVLFSKIEVIQKPSDEEGLPYRLINWEQFLNRIKEVE
ncbi:hypothetical protein [Microbulbifer aestuariivivens]